MELLITGHVGTTVPAPRGQCLSRLNKQRDAATAGHAIAGSIAMKLTVLYATEVLQTQLLGSKLAGQQLICDSVPNTN